MAGRLAQLFIPRPVIRFPLINVRDQEIDPFIEKVLGK